MTSATTHHTSPTELDSVLDAAVTAARPWAEQRPVRRARALCTVADALDAAASELVPLAAAESHLAETRLRGELGRTTFQLRLFAGVLEEGSYLQATIDTPDQEWAPGPRPDLRRMLVPLGPVLVFAASNFPFAFSVAGGDTVAALAAGCPVVLKTHPGHPGLSEATARVVIDALREAGAPEGVFVVIHGDEAARSAVTDTRVRAGAFTGSLRGGRALFDLAVSRADPIPFYAEMGSVNPAFVTRAAARKRGTKIFSGYVDSFTMSTGQFCTQPGLLFVPKEAGAEDAIAAVLRDRPGAPLLNEQVGEGYAATLSTLTNHPAIRTVIQGRDTDAGPSPTLLATTVEEFLRHRADLRTECFGPTSILVSYSEEDQLLTVAREMGGQLTATLHGEDDDEIASPLLAELREHAGRVLWGGWPTGVAVSWAMQHGGPYPATTAVLSTSVGTAAIERFLRPVSYQSVPQHLLPEALRDDNPLNIPQRVNGAPPVR